MRYLYVDNFRGFSDTVIPIESVNFLVGENSTGKTSILAVLSLLSSPDFWFTQDFNSKDHEFGDFTDIVTAGSQDKSSFRIGFCQTRHSKKTADPTLICYLLTYKQRAGLPDLYYYLKVVNQKILSVILQKSRYRYRIDMASFKQPYDQPCICALFNRLKTMQKTQTTGFKKFPVELPPRQTVLPLLSMLDAIAEEKEPDISEISFTIPFFAPDLAWLAPIRTKPKRTYDGYGKPFSPEGEHTPYLLRKQFRSKATAEKFKKTLEAFGTSSGLFRKLQIKQFGTDATSPFELHVVLGKKPLRINSVGYGVSQALPVVVELLSRREECWFAIQQPEVHLHPKAQAALGDVLFQLMVQEGKHFLIETHSDFTIDRFRKNYRDANDDRYSAQVLFFERINGGNRVTPLKIMANGEYPQEQPKSFREFFLKEQMDVLGL